MVQSTNCAGDASKPEYDFSRVDAWQCFLKMGDGRVAGHAKDGVLDYDEIKFGIKTHLTTLEWLAAPNAAGVMERCDANGDLVITAAEFADNQKPSCIGTASDLCHVRGVCVREFPPAPTLPPAPSSLPAGQ